MPSDSQSKESMSLRLQPRDYFILRGLFECRLMTLAHATALYFDGKYEAARKRLQILRTAGYIGEKPRKIGEEMLLFLTKTAFLRLQSDGKLTDYPDLTMEQFLIRSKVQPATIKHELAVMDVRVAITNAIAKSELHRLSEFTTWPMLSQFEAVHPLQKQRVIIRPDGFVHLMDKSEEHEYFFFLELDRSSEVQRVLAEKALCYRDFYASGGFALRQGAGKEDFRDYPFRVLMILQSAERRNNTAERLMNCTPPIKFQTWLTTQEEVLRDPLGKIWSCPLDYAHATEGTIYAPVRWQDGSKYVRRPERERMVEEKIVKRTLFEDAHSPGSK